jgi:hypothetical protein
MQARTAHARTRTAACIAAGTGMLLGLALLAETDWPAQDCMAVAFWVSAAVGFAWRWVRS